MQERVWDGLGGRVPARFRAVVDADDVRQEACLRVYRSGADFAGRSAAERECYQRRSLASALGDSLRFLNRARRRADRAATPVEDMASDWRSPSCRASRNEQLVRLAEALAALPADQRTAVTLHHLQGHSLTETAEAMGRSFASVAGLLRRALKDLRTRLAEP
jgi:RNA polymerase sigma-70 factor (ECF subfamily)